MVVPHGIPIAGWFIMEKYVSKIRWFGCPPMTQRKPLPPIEVMEWQAKDWFGIGSLFILVSMRRIWDGNRWKDFPGFSNTWIIILLTSCETQIREVSPPVSDPKKEMKRRQIWKSRHPKPIPPDMSSVQSPAWLMIIGDYTTQHIGDYSNPRTGNPYKPTRIKWNDSGIWTLLIWAPDYE